VRILAARHEDSQKFGFFLKNHGPKAVQMALYLMRERLKELQYEK
jgi:hypothetical protein